MKNYSVIIENLMDGIITNLEEAYDYGYHQGYEDGKKENCDCTDNMEHEYIRGLNDAWEVIQNIAKDDTKSGYSYKMMMDIFGVYRIYDIVQKYAPQDVIRMIKEYEEQQIQDNEQEQDTEIKVGDEVVIDDSIGIVTRAFPGAVTCYVMREDGSSGEEDRNDCKTTGRHFDQIAEVFAEMRGEKA